jgi:chemotaxis protein CheD
MKSFTSAAPSLTPALPLEFTPQIAGASDSRHRRHYLIPGRIFVSPQPCAITTIVGSGCVLCVWDPTTGIGGASHFLFPDGPEAKGGAEHYGIHAAAQLLKRLQDLAADTAKLRAKLYGGAYPMVTFGNTAECLGHRNVKFAERFLQQNAIRVVETETFGTQGRKVVFQTDDGQAWAQQL